MTINLPKVNFDIFNAEETVLSSYGFSLRKIGKFSIGSIAVSELLSTTILTNELRKLNISDINLLSIITDPISIVLTGSIFIASLGGYIHNRNNDYNKAIEDIKSLESITRLYGYTSQELIDAYSIYYTKQRLYINHLIFQSLYENSGNELISIRQTIDKRFIGSKLISTELLTEIDAKEDIIDTEATYYNPSKLIRARCLTEKS